jgi:CBS domain-containing protein
MGLRESLWQDDLSQLNLKPPLVVSPGQSIRHTVDAMRAARSGCALVCEGDEIVGIFTERDLLLRVFDCQVNSSEPISTVMTNKPVTVRSNDPIGWLVRTMYQGHYRHLPIVDEQNRLVGVVSVKQIVSYLADHFPAAVYTVPPEPHRPQEAREGA